MMIMIVGGRRPSMFLCVRRKSFIYKYIFRAIKLLFSCLGTRFMWNDTVCQYGLMGQCASVA